MTATAEAYPKLKFLNACMYIKLGSVWVWSIGPPLVMKYTCGKKLKAPLTRFMITNAVTYASMGTVMLQNCLIPLAPSIWAAS